MMNKEEREQALADMQQASDAFYTRAILIGVHPFIEFTGLMNEYIKVCRSAHEQGIDFTECSKHSDKELPMTPFEVNYVNEKLECIFTGRSVMNLEKFTGHPDNEELTASNKFKAEVAPLILRFDAMIAKSVSDPAREHMRDLIDNLILSLVAISDGDLIQTEQREKV